LTPLGWATLGTGPLAAIRDEEVTNTRHLTLSVDQPEFPGSVTFRSRFLDFTGRFVHHCQTRVFRSTVLTLRRLQIQRSSRHSDDH
jgi:hypothetical protein